jgi:hypothetical protein
LILSPFFHQHTQIRVASKNKCGWSQWSTVSTYKTKSKTPSPPLHPPTCSAITLNTIHLSWKEPLDNGGESIIGYSVELDSNTKKKQYEIVGNKLNTKLKALQPQTKYNIRVCSINAIGRSAWTEWMHVETKARINEIPSTPYIVDTKVLNNKSFHVSWSMDHQKSSSPGGGSRRRRKSNNTNNTNSSNSRSTAAGIDSSLLFHVYVDCDDGRMFHQVHECQSIMNATIHGIASTTGSVKCRVQTSHAVSHQRSPFSPTVHVQMFSLKARQRKKQQEAVQGEQKHRNNRSSSSGDNNNLNDSKQKHKSMDKKAAKVALQKKIFWSKLKKKINKYGPMVFVLLGFLVLIGLSFDKKVVVPKKAAVEPRATTEMAAAAAEVAAEAVAPVAVATPAAVSMEKSLSSLQEKARENAERLTAPVASATVAPDAGDGVADESRTTKANEPSFV